MISIRIGTDALGQVRLATSPLWETMASLQLLAQNRSVPWPYTGWAQRARPSLAAGLGGDLVRWFRARPGPVPAFLAPLPTEATPAIADELDALRRTPAEVVREQLAAARGPDPFGGQRPETWLRWCADAVADYWDRAVRPAWPSIRAALQEDVLHRAHLLATQGVRVLLERLEGRIHWEEPRLVISGTAGTETLSCQGRLVIVPLLFGRWMARCVPDDTGAVAVSCQARGAAVLANNPPHGNSAASVPQRGDRLTILVGRGRAAVIRGLATPTTTSTLASVLGLSASTVSEHLTALVAANVVQRRRIGGRVLYELDRTGSALLGYLDNGA
ncbi:helix-turn-helix domain-containing protein [Dactylosporangium sp. NPDC051541]|uniref:ArsR/SmtB family transcription factor n=1 Tax=Dactylosporangium sp. NPDC051541 TaxID=3363977 RepID=UPI0037B84279